MEIGLLLILMGLALTNAFFWYAQWQERLRLERQLRHQLELINEMRIRRRRY